MLKNWLFEKLEHGFVVAFALEMIIKVIAKGLFAQEACYLRDPWNWLDGTVVVVSILSYFPSVSNVSSLRTFRLFRPLRSLKNPPLTFFNSPFRVDSQNILFVIISKLECQF